MTGRVPSSGVIEDQMVLGPLDGPWRFVVVYGADRYRHEPRQMLPSHQSPQVDSCTMISSMSVLHCTFHDLK